MSPLFCLILPHYTSAGVKDHRVKPPISIEGIRESKPMKSFVISKRRMAECLFLDERAESCLGRDCMAQLVRQSPPPALLLMGPGAVIGVEVIVIIVAIDMVIVVIEHKADQL